MKMEPTLSEIAEKMKCSHCTGYLRPPINSRTDGTSVCGLCKDKVPTVGVNTCLESIGGMLNFPCKYVTNNCPSKLPWKDLEVHEIGCPYRKYTCPLCTGRWLGNVSALQTHIRQKHSICKTDLRLYLTVNEKDNLIWLNMKSIKPLNEMRTKYFRVTISANGSRYIDFMPVEYALNWDLNRDMALKVDICVLKMKLKMKSNDVIIGSEVVNIGFEVFTREPIYNNETDGNMLTELECPVCHEYMAAPIYMCIVGHSICNYCKSKLQSCPSCRSPFSTSIRNYTLESISNKLHYKCMYTEQGCKFTSLLGQIQNHELTCDHGHCDCPLKDFVNCSWRGCYNEMNSHALEKHGFKF